MGTGGFSKVRLGRLHDVMAGYVERGEAPGIVTLVSRRGEVHVDAIGKKAIGDSEPIRRDTIFRIASMTKPIIAAATTILVEECRLRLSEPVDRLLPELSGRRVLKSLDGPVDDTVPAKRPITVRDLLTFRLGFGMIMAPPGMYPIQKLLDEQGFGPAPPNPAASPEPDEWMRRLGTLPLLFQPGERWMYNTGSDILGVLIARASGQSLETFLRERIFDPLGMRDTGFIVPANKLDRLASSYMVHPATWELQLFDGAKDSLWSRPPTFPSGAGGLVSTADDFLAFGQMMLNKGKWGNQRILSRPSIELMTTDQLTPEQKAASDFGNIWDSHGWGFGMSVVTKRDDLAKVPGQYGWDGGLGTTWRSDPAEELVGIQLTQRAWTGPRPPETSPRPPDLSLDFWTATYQAIED